MRKYETWVAVDKDGQENIFKIEEGEYLMRYIGEEIFDISHPDWKNRPETISIEDLRKENIWIPICLRERKIVHKVPLPKGSIQKLILRTLTWEDDAVQLI